MDWQFGEVSSRRADLGDAKIRRRRRRVSWKSWTWVKRTETLLAKQLIDAQTAGGHGRRR